MNTKGVVLAAGEGKRMKPVSEIVPKEMVPILGKPFLYYVLRKLAQAEIRDIVIVASEWKLPLIRRLDASRLGVRLDYVVQKKPLGPAQALLEAKPFLDTEQMLVYYGDNVAEGNVPLELLRSSHINRKADAVISLRAVSDTSRYGIARFDANRLVEIVEKPPEGTEPSRLAAMGVYIMKTDNFFDSLKGIAFEYGKEQFPPQYILRAGGRVASWTFSGRWVDMGKPVDMLRASTLISNSPIRCVVLKADHTLYRGALSSLGARGATEPDELMNEISRFIRATRIRGGFVVSSKTRDIVKRDLGPYDLRHLRFKSSNDSDVKPSLRAYEKPLGAFKPKQLLVIGGDYRLDLLGPAQRGMHVLLVRGKEDIASLKAMTSDQA